jgi:phage terminase large subunit
MSNNTPRSQQELNRDAFLLREYLTDDEKALLDKALWSPKRALERYRTDPLAFCREVLKMSLAYYQEDVLTELVTHYRVCFRGPHGAGKSTIAAAAVLWFIAVHDECKIITTASAWRQLTEYLWPEIHKWAGRAEWWRIGLKIRNGKELMKLKLEIGETGNRFATAVASNDPAKIEGAHSEKILYVFDESKAIINETWDAAEGALGTPGSYALSLSTPGDSIGRFYDIQTKREKYAAWSVVAVTDEDCIKAGRMTEAWRAQRALEWGTDSPMYMRRVQGKFAEDSGDTLIRLSWVEKAQERWHELWQRVDELVESGTRTRAEAEDDVWGALSDVGCDPARSGADKTGWAFRHGNYIKSIKRTDEADTTITGDILCGWMEDNTALGKVDVNGLGAGAFDYARRQWSDKKWRTQDVRCPVIAINVSNATKVRDKTGELTFNRLRDYIWWSLREKLEAAYKGLGDIALPPDDDLAKDLVAYKWTTTHTGKVLIESKDEVKKVLGRSTDTGDAVVLSFAPDAPPYKPMIGFV